MSDENDSRNLRDLVARLQGGDERALVEFIVVHEQRVRSIVGRVLDDPGEIAEATQDTFVRVWRGIGGFRGDAAVSTWVHRIAMNEALARVRRKRHPQVSYDALAPVAADDGDDLAAETAARRARVRAVRAALAQLPEEQRAAVVLRDLEGFSSAQAAAVLGIAEPALKTRLHRGRMRLRTLLADQFRDGEW